MLPPVLRPADVRSSTPAPGTAPLCQRTLPLHAGRIRVPHYDRTALTPSVVHFSVGGFHRAHQLVYFDDLAERGHTGWGVIGIGLRSAAMRDALAPQDLLYTVVERGHGVERARVVGSMVGYHARGLRAQPDLVYAFNPDFERTNTSKSLLRALRSSQPGGVLWLNGDVVFDPAVLDQTVDLVAADQSFVCVDTATVADEEVKYTLDEDGFIRELSKTVVGGLGEAVGINYVSAADKPVLIEHLGGCADNDYSERAMETAIQDAGVRFRPLDISRFSAVEVDFETDLERANTWLSSRAALEPLADEFG